MLDQFDQTVANVADFGPATALPISEQVFTRAGLGEVDQGLEHIQGTQNRAIRTKALHTLCVEHKASPRAKRKGGWKSTKYLSWAEVKAAEDLAHAARGARRPLNVMLTVRGARGEREATAKRGIQTKIARFGQALHRRGVPHVGLTIYERSPDLHAHHLLHLPHEHDDILARFADGQHVHARPADREAVEYVTKQRRWLGPEIERKINRQWVAGAAIVGRRWSPTASLKALVSSPGESARPAQSSPPMGRKRHKSDAQPSHTLIAALIETGLFGGLLPVQEVPSKAPQKPRPRPPIVNRAQPDLPFERPPDIRRLLHLIPGRSDRERAAAVGISGPQFSNFKAGRFGVSAPVARRILELAQAA